MASGDTRNILKGPHRLVLTPTDLSAAYPYGGTELGLARGLELRWGHKGHTERAEEWGGTAARRLYVGDWVVVMGILRSWDADAVASIIPTYVAGGSGKALSQVDVNTDGTRGGRYLTAAKILVVPYKSPTSQLSALIYAGLPMIQEAAKIDFSARTEAGIAVAWEGSPDDNGKVVEVGYLEDITV